jgi:hypothetical protein
VLKFVAKKKIVVISVVYILKETELRASQKGKYFCRKFTVCTYRGPATLNVFYIDNPSKGNEGQTANVSKVVRQ